MRQSTNTLCLIFAQVDHFCKHLKKHVRKGGPKPAFTRNQLIKMIVLKYLLGITSDRSYIRFLHGVGSGLFKRIPEHSWFSRRTKRLVPLCEQFRRDLLERLNVQGDPIRIIDSTPIPVVKYARRCGPLAYSFERASYGYCASQDEKYLGLKLHLLTTSSGIPTRFELTEASVHDITMLEELLDRIRDAICLGDKGYFDTNRKHDLLVNQNVQMITPEKKHQSVMRNTQTERVILKKRKRIEITLNQLKDQFQLTCQRAKSLLGLTTRVMGIMLAMTLGVYINRLLGKPDFKLKELLL